MNRALLTLLATGLSLIPAVAAAETLPLPLSGPAYTAANSHYLEVRHRGWRGEKAGY